MHVDCIGRGIGKGDLALSVNIGYCHIPKTTAGVSLVDLDMDSAKDSKALYLNQIYTRMGTLHMDIFARGVLRLETRFRA